MANQLQGRDNCWPDPICHACHQGSPRGLVGVEKAGKRSYAHVFEEFLAMEPLPPYRLLYVWTCSAKTSPG